MRAIEEMVAVWRSEGTTLNPPATDRDLLRLEQLLGVPLPEDIRSFYGLADGMPEHESDACQLSFWSIDQIAREHAQQNGTHRGTGRELAFADVLAETHRYLFRVSSTGVLRVGHDLDVADEEPSLEAFFQRYLERPEDMPVLVDPRPSRRLL